MTKGLHKAVSGLFCALGMLAVVAATAPARAQEATVKQVASDLYFFFDYNGSNAVFLVTDDGVLLIDTRTHPRDGAGFAGAHPQDHRQAGQMGDQQPFPRRPQLRQSVVQGAGATFVAQEETARIMQKVQPKEMARRIDVSKARASTRTKSSWFCRT